MVLSAPAASKADQVVDGTVFVVDDDGKVRRCISALFGSVGLSCELFVSAGQFLDQFDVEQTGCLVLDIRMPTMSGLELQEELRARGSRLPIIFLTGHGEVPMVAQAMRAGAVDFIQKPFSGEVLLERVQEALAREREHSRHSQLKCDVQKRIAKLTEREQELMHLLAAGESAKSIGRRLEISHKTVENHRTRIWEKMLVENSTQLAHLLLYVQ